MSNPINRTCSSTPSLHFAKFVESREPRGIKPLHTHPHWQVELILEGTPTLALSDGYRTTGPGDIVLLPPQAPHEFCYDEGYTSWYTLRFSLDSSQRQEVQIVKDGCYGHFFSLLTALLDRSNRQLAAPDEEAIEHALAGLVAYTYGDRNVGATGSLFLDKVNDYLSQNCSGPIAVAEVAQCVGYSESHTRALYKKSTGRSLKDAIDHARFDEALQYIQHSDFTISEIAEELGFPDVFSFSRFIRRLAKTCPSAIRKAYAMGKESVTHRP